MPYITAADGIELYYEVEGDGFPLVFTHGNEGFGRQYFLQARIMSKKYKCIMHDLRGCGLSSKPDVEVYDVKEQAAYLHAILTELGVKRAVHFGHSWGGGISLQYYFDYPGEVAGIVFIGSYSAGNQLAIDEPAVLKFYETVQGRQEVFKTLVAHEKFYKYNPYGDEIGTLLWKEACKGPIYAANAICKGFFRYDFTPRLPEVKVPCLIIHGDDDKPCPFETCAKVLNEKLPDARLVVVKDTGHFCHMEKPEIANEAIWDWLEEKIKQ